MWPFDWIVDLVSDSPWTYALVLGLVLLDADLPVLPGETVIITAAIAAAEGDISVWLVFLAGALGGLAGDNVSYFIGHRWGGPAYRRLFRSEKARERYAWTRDALERHGLWAIPAIRFVPMGRTAVTLASGTVRIGWRGFFVADLVGVIIWAALQTGIGTFGGETFERSTWAAFAVAFGMAGLIAGVGWLSYRLASDG